MKKSFLAILLALVMCLGIVGLVACEQPDDGGDIPVAEGKVTLYFTLGEKSVAVPEYASIYYAGGLTNWNDGAEKFPMTRLEKEDGTVLYYVQLVWDASINQADEYKVGMGYNATSGLGADKLCIDWSFTSDECPGGLDNAKFEYDGTSKTINLGTHTFSAALPEPEQIDTELRITFKEALGENARVYVMGDFNGWNADKALATASEDRTVYSLALSKVVCSTYGYKVLVFRDFTDAAEADSVWGMKSKTNPEESAFIEISAGGDNIKVTLVKRDDKSHVDLCDTISETNELLEQTKTGIDLGGAVLDNGSWKLSLAQEVTYTIEFTTALTEGARIFLLGDMNSWGGDGPEAAEMTLAADRKSATITLVGGSGEYSFKAVVVAKGVEIAKTQDIWDHENPVGGNGNQKVTVLSKTAALFAEPQADPLNIASVESVTLTVKFAGALEGKYVYIAGSWNWGGAKMTTEDNITFSITLTDMLAKEYEFLVCVGSTDEIDWNGKIGAGATWGGANATVTIPAEGGTVALFGTTEVATSAPAAE